MERDLVISRRAVLRGGTLLLGASWARGMADGDPAIRFGVVTDVHHADKTQWGTRYYRESLTKLREGVVRFREADAAFMIQLGDLVDAAKDVETERLWLQEAVKALREGGVKLFSVLGNHCIQTLTKAQFLHEVGQDRGHYSFDRGGFRFIVLDACYRKDGVSYDAGNFDWKDTEVPVAQRAWLTKELETAREKVLIFVHQRLDNEGVHTVASAPEIRQILERSGKVLAVFQGHSHQNDYREVNGIHYCTMRAVIEGSGLESNGYSLVSVYRDGRVAVKGFRAQRDYSMS